MGGIARAVNMPKLFAILIAVAMLFAPFAMPIGSASAAMPSDHHAEMMGEDHCEGQPATGKDGRSAEKPCCAAVCGAVAVAMGSPLQPAIFARAVERPALDPFRPGFLAKLPTPPPRLA